jgi:hypothetical protein
MNIAECWQVCELQREREKVGGEGDITAHTHTLHIKSYSEICKCLEIQIQRQIQPNRAQIRGQIPPNTRGEPINAPDTRPDTPDTATFSIWPLVVSICISSVAYFTE